jgi:hypothetical protein
VSWLRPASGWSCEGSNINSAGFCIAVLGSKGVGEKESCGANSVAWGDWEGWAVDLRPVNVSQLSRSQSQSRSLIVSIEHIHRHSEDGLWWYDEEMEGYAWPSKA